MNRRTLALVLVPTLAAASALTVVFGVQLTSTPPSSAQLLACVSEQSLADPDRYLASEKECVTEVIVQAATAASIPAIADGLDQLNTANLKLCHRAAHEAGARLWPRDGNWERVLDTVDTSLCNSGILHGVFDMMPLQENFSSDDWASVAGWCASHQSIFPAPANCADAMGHASWDSTKDRLRAYDRCALLGNDSLISECVEGVEMQRFTPASRPDRWDRIDLSEIRAICRDVPADAREGFRRGCARAYAYLAYEALQQDPANPAPYLNPSVTSAFTTDAIAACASVSAEFEQDCASRYLWLFKYLLVNSAEQIPVYCPPLGVWEQICTEELTKPLT